MQRGSRLETDLMMVGIGVQQVEGLKTLGGDDRCEPARNGRAQPPATEGLVAGFDQDAGEVLRQDAAEVLPFVEERARDTRLQVLAMMVVVVPDTRWLVIPAYPDHRVLSGLPAELEALEVVLVIGDQVFAKELERTPLDGEQGVDLHDFIDDLRNRRLPIEGPGR